MRAIDTNILVRYLTKDDPEQSRKARALIEGGDIFACTTVFLESEWVLRRVYGYSSPAICHALRAFAGMPGVTIENAPLLTEALDRTEAGMDFADALHLGSASGCESFFTFDRKLIKAAAGLNSEVREP